MSVYIGYIIFDIACFSDFLNFHYGFLQVAQTQLKARNHIHCQRRTGFSQGGALLNGGKVYIEGFIEKVFKRFSMVRHHKSQDELSPEDVVNFHQLQGNFLIVFKWAHDFTSFPAWFDQFITSNGLVVESTNGTLLHRFQLSWIDPKGMIIP